MSSVMLKCKDPTYRRIGPELPLCKLLAMAARRFFSACEACTMIGTPSNLCPVSPMARGTDWISTNSTYAIPFDLREFLSEIILTSRTLPTAEKKSSKSRGRMRAASCIQNTVRASRSSGDKFGSGCLTGLVSLCRGLRLLLRV